LLFQFIRCFSLLDWASKGPSPDIVVFILQWCQFCELDVRAEGAGFKPDIQMQVEEQEKRYPIPRNSWFQDESNQLPSSHSQSSPLPWTFKKRRVRKCCEWVCTKYIQGIIQSTNVPIVSVDHICPWEETLSPIWNQDIVLEGILRVPLCGVLMVLQGSSGLQVWWNTNLRAKTESGEEKRMREENLGEKAFVVYLLNSQLLFCFDDQLQEDILRLS